MEEYIPVFRPNAEYQETNARHRKIETCITFLQCIWESPNYKTYEDIISYLKDKIPQLKIWENKNYEDNNSPFLRDAK